MRGLPLMLPYFWVRIAKLDTDYRTRTLVPGVRE
jgi:hypothetical protein